MSSATAFPAAVPDAPNPPNRSTLLYRKLRDIMAAVSYIQKDKRNQAQGYNYLSEQAIKESLHDAMVEHGVLFMPSVGEVRHEVIGLQNAKGERRDVLLTTVSGFAQFIDVETGDSITVSMVGSGSDSNDKGTYKAITGALKYALTGAFLIPSGDDPENDGGKEESNPQRAPRQRKPVESAPAPAPQAAPKPAAPQPAPAPTPAPAPQGGIVRKVTPGQVKRLFTIAGAHKWSVEQAKWMVKQEVAAESSNDIPDREYDRLIRILEGGYEAYAIRIDAATNK